MIHIWVEHLNVPKILWILLRYSLQHIVLFYSTATPLGKYTAGFLCNLNIKYISLRQEDIELGVQDKKGRALRYYVERQTSSLVSSLFQRQSKQNDWLPEEYRKCSDEWIRILKSHCMMYFKNTLRYVCGVENKYRKNEIKTEGVKKVIIYADHCAMGSHIRDSYEFNTRIPFEIRIFSQWKYNLTFFPVPGIIAYVLLKSFGSLIKSKPKSKIVPTALQKGCVFEEYVSNIFTNYPARGHLFWYQSSGLSSDRLVVFFDRPDSPCDKKAISEVESYNFSWIDISDPWRFVRNPVRMAFVILKKSRKAIPRRWNEFYIWRWASLIYFSSLLECYREIYRVNKVRAVHQHQEWWPLTIVKALAIRMEDGIMIWNHWSIDRYPVAYYDCGLADLVLSWGQLNDGYFNAHNFSYKYLIQTGMIAGDGFDGSENNRALKIRNQFSSSVKYVVAVFDNSHSKTSHSSTSSMLFFYERLLKVILDKKQWGILIKPKGLTFVNAPHKESVQSVIDQLEIDQRCIHLSGKERVSVAAIASDVNVCYGINTAGILAALCGKKCVHWDLDGCLEHPLYYVGGENRVVFKPFSELVCALEAIENGDAVLGDHSEWLYLFDAFQDNLGNTRAGELVGAYLRHYDSGMERDSSLRKAVEEYAARWGDDKVSIARAAQNHLGNDLWAHVMKNVFGDIDGK